MASFISCKGSLVAVPDSWMVSFPRFKSRLPGHVCAEVNVSHDDVVAGDEMILEFVVAVGVVDIEPTRDELLYTPEVVVR